MEITQEENLLLQKLVQDYAIPEFDPVKHVTSATLSEQLGVNQRTALNYLEEEYSKGNLEREKIRLDTGHVAWGYFQYIQIQENTGD